MRNGNDTAGPAGRGLRRWSRRRLERLVIGFAMSIIAVPLERVVLGVTKRG